MIAGSMVALVTPMDAQGGLDWDSLSNIRLVVAVEEEFEMLFTTGEVAGLNDVGEFVKVIQKRASE